MGSPNSHPFIGCEADTWCLTEKETDAKTNKEMSPIHPHAFFRVEAER